MPPRRNQFGRKQRTAKERRDALRLLLWQCRPEQLPTFTPEGLEASYGVPANDCATMLGEARRVRS